MKAPSIFAIGDIHGTYDKLTRLMDKIPFEPQQDTLVFMGDYIDRGAQSWEVVEYLLELQHKAAYLVFLKGNHEELLMQYLQGRDRLTFLGNGGRATLESYMQHKRPEEEGVIPARHRSFFQSLQLGFETEHYLFVHAGVRGQAPLSQQRPEDLLWIREPFISSKRELPRKVIFGHTPFPEPLVMPNKIGIDTGAVYGNMLTCVELPQERFYHT